MLRSILGNKDIITQSKNLSLAKSRTNVLFLKPPKNAHTPFLLSIYFVIKLLSHEIIRKNYLYQHILSLTINFIFSRYYIIDFGIKIKSRRLIRRLLI